jgi:hypothetical protein
MNQHEVAEDIAVVFGILASTTWTARSGESGHPGPLTEQKPA